MTDKRSLADEERAAAEGEHVGADPEEEDPTATSAWSRECGSDCGCLSDRGSPSEPSSGPAHGDATASAVAGAKSVPEPRISMVPAMRAQSQAPFCRVAPFSERKAESSAGDSAPESAESKR